MSKLNYVMGMLAAGGAVAATGSEAGSITYTLNLPITSDASLTPITLLGAVTPQYEYGDFSAYGSPDAGLISYNFATAPTTKSDVGIVLGYTVGGTPLTEDQFALAYNSKTIPLAAQNPYGEFEAGPDATTPPGGTDHYTYLVFTTDSSPSTPQFGYAHISGDNVLATITVTTVPEPESWALLVAGAGLAGAALRQGRRRALSSPDRQRAIG